MTALLVIAVVAAARSTWSPCGWSVLSTMTPLAERARGHRFAVTAAWYVLGAVLGGLSLGVLVAGLALVVTAVDLPGAALVGGVCCLLCAAADTSAAPVTLPGHRRQVNEDWLESYRPWVYGLGYGWQIGTGLVTYLRTTSVYALVVLGALAGWRLAVLCCLVFGLVRGLAVLLSAGCTTRERLVAFHRRFAAADPVTREVTALTCAAVGLWLLAGWLAVGVLALGLAVLVPLRPAVSPR